MTWSGRTPCFLCFFSCARSVTSLAPWGMATSIFISLLAFSNVKYALQHALSVADDGADNAGGLILSDVMQPWHHEQLSAANSNLHRKQQPMDQGFLCILGYSMCLGWNLRLRKWLNSASIFFPVYRYTVRLQKQMCDHWICRETFELTYPNLQSHESAQHSTVLYTKARQVAFHSKRWMHSLSMQSGC